MNIKNWVGADLSERSFRQIYSGHLERIGQFDGNSTDTVEREVTLFDNQMVISYLVSKICECDTPYIILLPKRNLLFN